MVILTYGYRDAHELALLKCRACLFDKIAEEDAYDHGEKNPHREKAIQPAK